MSDIGDLTERRLKRARLRKIAAAMTSRWTEQSQLDKLCDVFGRVDTTMAGRLIKCVASDNLRYPSMTDGKTIQFDRTTLGNPTDYDAMVAIMGLNWHELGHCLISPRSATFLKKLQDNGWFLAYNILEDQRLETYVTTRWPSLAPYYIAAFMRYALSNDDMIPKLYPYSHGRRFLPRSLRRKIRYAFEIESELVRDRLAEIIDEYRTSVVVTDAEQAGALVLVEEFSNLLGSLAADCNTHPVTIPNQGRPETGLDQGRVMNDAIAQGKADDKQQARETRQAKKKGQPEVSDEDIKGQLQQVLAKVGKDGQISREVGDMQHRISDGGWSAGSQVGQMGRSSAQNVTPEMRRIASRFRDKLRVVREELDPSWERSTPTGKLNVQRVIRGVDPTAMFDRWSGTENDASALECVVLVDLSSSMIGEAVRRVSMAAWCIRQGVMSLDPKAQVTVYGFNTEFCRLIDRAEPLNSKVYPLYQACGGTEPDASCREAFRLLHLSPLKRKMCVILTDGEWGGTASTTTIPAMGEYGIATAVALYMSTMQQTVAYCPRCNDHHVTHLRNDDRWVCTKCGWSRTSLAARMDRASDYGAQVRVIITDPMDLVKVAEGVAVEVMRRG